MKTISRTLLLVSLGAAPVAHANEFRAMYGAWAFDISGTATQDSRPYDFQEDLAAQRAGKRSISVAWDTSPGWWPDLAFSDARIGVNGTHTESATGLPPPFPQSDVTLTLDSDFTDQDLVARWPLIKESVKVSLGVAAKHLKGTVVITDSSQGESRGDYDETIPELHVAARWSPAHWLALDVTGQGVQAGENKAFEWRAGVELRPFDPVLLSAAWQQKRYDVTVGDDALDVSLDGLLLQAGLLFR